MATGEAKFRLVLDTKQFTDAAKDAMVSFEGIGKASAVAAAVVAGAVVGVAAAFGKAASSAIDYADSIGLSADKMSVTAEAAQRLAFSAAMLDIPFGAVESAVGKMTVNLENTPEAFTRLGLSMETLKTQAPDEQLAAVADKLSAIESPTQRASAAAAIFGKGWMDLAPLLLAGGDAIRTLGADAERLGTVQLNSVIAAGRDMDDALTKLNAVWDGWVNNIGAAFTTSEPLHVLLEGMTEILGAFSKGTQDSTADLRSFVDGGVRLAAIGLEGLVSVAGFAIDMWSAFQIATEGTRVGLQTVAIMSVAAAEAMQHPTQAGGILKQALLDVAAAGNAGSNAIRAEIAANTERRNKLADVEIAVGKLSKAIADADGQVHQATDENKKFGGSLGATAAEIRKATAEHEKWVASLSYYNTSGKFVGPTMDDLEGILQKSFGKNSFAIHPPMLTIKPKEAELVLPGGVMNGPKLGEQLAAGMKLGLSTAMKDLPQVIMATLQGGGDMGKAIGGLFGSSIGKSLQEPLTKGLTSVLGKGIGGALGSVVPGLGTALGAIGGELAGKLFGKLFGGEGKKVNDLRDQFVAAAGGITELDKRAHAAGMTLDQLLKASNVKDYEAAVRSLTGAFDLQAQATQVVKDAQEKYGLTIEEMGPKFAAQEMDAQVGGLIKEYEALINSGADVVAVTTKMGPAMNEYVQQAMKAGVAIPENMRAPLQKMIELGLLTDEAGNKMESLDGINFTESLSEGLSKAVAGINELVAAIRQLAGLPPINIPVHVGSGGGAQVPDYHGGKDEGQAVGYYSPSLPKDMAFSAHKGEAVTITRASDSPGQGQRAPGGGPVDVRLSFDTIEFQRFVTASIKTGHIRVDAPAA